MKPDFKIFFLCEDWVSMGRALELKEKLAHNCRDHVSVKGDFYSYARLCHPRLKQAALDQAREADLLIIAARGSEPMPLFVQKWMDEAASRRSEKTACGEFLDSKSSDTVENFHSFIDRWAAENSFLLFSNVYPEQPAEPANLN